jgi:hypothetical protein
LSETAERNYYNLFRKKSWEVNEKEFANLKLSVNKICVYLVVSSLIVQCRSMINAAFLSSKIKFHVEIKALVENAADFLN